MGRLARAVVAAATAAALAGCGSVVYHDAKAREAFLEACAATLASGSAWAALWRLIAERFVAFARQDGVTIAIEVAKASQRCAVLAWPYVRDGAKAAVDWAAAHPKATLSGLAAVVLLWALVKLVAACKRRRVRQRIAGALGAVFAPARKAAKAYHDWSSRMRTSWLGALLPHTVFVAVAAAAVASRSGPVPLQAVIFIAIGVPLVRTVSSLQRRGPEDQQLLQYWVIVLFWWTAYAGVGLLGIDVLKWAGDKWRPIALCLCLWLQVPGTAEPANQLLFSVSGSVLRWRVNLPTEELQAKSEEYSQLLKLAVKIGAVSDARAALLTDALRGGWVLVCGVFFIIPLPLAVQFGCLLAGHGFPIYDAFCAHHQKNALAMRRLLTYFPWCAVFFTAHSAFPVLDYLPLGAQLRLAGYFWLQLPVCNGAHVLMGRCPPLDFLPGGGDDKRSRSKSGVVETPAEDAPAVADKDSAVRSGDAADAGTVRRRAPAADAD